MYQSNNIRRTLICPLRKDALKETDQDCFARIACIISPSVLSNSFRRISYVRVFTRNEYLDGFYTFIDTTSLNVFVDTLANCVFAINVRIFILMKFISNRRLENYEAHVDLSLAAVYICRICINVAARM